MGENPITPHHGVDLETFQRIISGDYQCPTLSEIGDVAEDVVKVQFDPDGQFSDLGDALEFFGDHFKDCQECYGFYLTLYSSYYQEAAGVERAGRKAIESAVHETPLPERR
tara:strand:- start:33 stop:365 length:333 start_codon:yes stop_codon:yes gene_type:complete